MIQLAKDESGAYVCVENDEDDQTPFLYIQGDVLDLTPELAMKLAENLIKWASQGAAYKGVDQ